MLFDEQEKAVEKNKLNNIVLKLNFLVYQAIIPETHCKFCQSEGIVFCSTNVNKKELR